VQNSKSPLGDLGVDFLAKLESSYQKPGGSPEK